MIGALAAAASAAGPLLGGIGSMIFGKSGGMDELKEAKRVISNVKSPDFNLEEIEPYELSLVAKYDPIYYETEIPDNIKEMKDSPELRQAQLQGLEQLKQVAAQGITPQEQVAAERIQEGARSAARGQTQQALRNLAETGRLSSGSELAASLGGAQVAGNLAREQGRDLLTEALNRKLQASQAATQQAGAIRGQDVNVSQQQAEMLNRWNQWRTGMQQEEARRRAMAEQTAQAYNIQQQQRIAEENQRAAYENALANLQRQNELERQRSQFELQKATGEAGALSDISRAKYAEQAARSQQIQGLGKAIGGMGSAIGGMMGGMGGGGASAPQAPAVGGAFQNLQGGGLQGLPNSRGMIA